METFKTELRALLAKYPQVKNVKFDITESVSLADGITFMGTTVQPSVVTPAVSTANPAYVSPQAQALTQAEQTIANLTSRAGIKVQQ